MFRDVTFTDVNRLDARDASAEFVMDEDTFRAFYDRTARGLWAYLARVTGDRHTADDLLQETFYRFLRASAEHDSEAHRRNSLYRIATNLARDARRRSLVRPFAHVAGHDIEGVPRPAIVKAPPSAALISPEPCHASNPANERSFGSRMPRARRIERSPMFSGFAPEA